MATTRQCDLAIAHLTGMFNGADETVRNQAEERTVSLFVPDLDLVYSGKLCEGRLQDVTTAPQEPAQIRVTIRSDDLVDLVEGRLGFAQAFGHGRVHIDASIRDLFRLRSLL